MKSSNKIYTILLSFAAVCLILAVFFIWPLIGEIQKNSADLISAKNNIVTSDAQATEVEKFNKSYEVYKPDLEKIDQLFVDPNNPVNFIQFLENTAASSQVTSQISLSAPSQQTSKNFIILHFSSKGDFSGILDFIKKLETGPYLVEIEDLKINKSQNVTTINNQLSNAFETILTIRAFTKQ